MLCTSVAYAVVWRLTVTFVYCVETAKAFIHRSVQIGH